MKLLIVGTLSSQLITASRIAQSKGARVYTASDTKAALHSIRNGNCPDVVMIDIEQDIKGFIEATKLERITVTVIACGINVIKDKVVAAIKAGAKEFIPLPPEEALIAAVFEAIAGFESGDRLIGKSEKFLELLDVVKQIAPTEASVLLTGESGTGKEIIARYIHNNSKRKSAEFISVNCAAIPENLLESELFGHEKGAFTGAIERRIGKFEQANNSTILLDEISEMDLRLQAKLLRAIQEREICRVGGKDNVKLDIRFIATSNKNLVDEVNTGRFREDLYYRLNVINIELPSLRSRLDDIVELSNFFIKKYAKLNGIEEKALTTDASEKLQKYDWPGNVRELENTIHRSLLLARDSTINSEAILLSKKPECANDDDTLEGIEKAAIRRTINRYKGDEAKAAMVLGISIGVLKNKLEQYKCTA